VTGEVLHVDSGYHTVGMVNVDSAAQTAELLNGIAPKKDAAA
jgi:enoyl-[acyl-carrier protein] reductase I